MSKLQRLIKTLTDQIARTDEVLDNIKNPQALLYHLNELNNLIGMDNVKNDIADQITFLIMAAHNEEENRYMLNTIFYGPPGVGKTKVGIILAKIWHSMGLINNETTIYHRMASYELDNMTLLIISLYVIYAIQIIALLCRQVGIVWITVIIGVLILIGILVYWIYFQNTYSETVSEITDPDIIKIVNRKDFVAEYVGQTAVKTNKLLNANRGKVLFIDEAYSLLNDHRDPFGMEALTTLNQFMSENYHDIIIIFAGYKDKMQNGIFAAQPGLPRRCMWHFECNGYHANELFDIFSSQLALDDWSIDRPHETIELIKNNMDCFPSFGGDTERLCFFAKLEANREAFHQGLPVNTCLTISQIQRGIELLSNNNIQNDDKPSSDHSQMDLDKLVKLYELLNPGETTSLPIDT